MRKLVCIVGQAGAACEGEGRASRLSVFQPRVSFPSSSPALSVSYPLFSTLVFPLRLSGFYPFVPVGYVRVPDSTLFPSLFPPFSLGFLHPALCVFRSSSSSFFFSLSSIFSPLRQETTGPLVSHRPAERKDCKPSDEPRDSGMGTALFAGFLRVSQERTSKSRTNCTTGRAVPGTQASAISRGGGISLALPGRVLIS